MRIVTNNNTFFCGKENIIYNLTKAAEEAKRIEIYKDSKYSQRPVINSLSEKFHEGRLGAYVDAIINDDTFNKSFIEISSDKKLIQNLKKILKPKKETHMVIPFTPTKILNDEFNYSLQNQKHKKQKQVGLIVLENFFDKLTK